MPGDFVLENIEAIEDDDAFGDDGTVTVYIMKDQLFVSLCLIAC